MRILVTGTRDNNPEYRTVVWRTLDAATFWAETPIVIVHGECPYGGVDEFAEQWATQAHATVEKHPAEIRNGRILGPERNSRMVALGADLCLGFPGPRSRGTWDCLRKAVDARIRTQIIALGGRPVPIVIDQGELLL